MFKGLLFFARFSWRHEKRYLLYRVFDQLVSSIAAIVSIIMPRYIINEMVGRQRIPYLCLYIGVLVGCIFAAGAVSSWLKWVGFTYRIKISQAFNVFMHEKTVNADYADIESSRYLEMKQRAEKFLFGNWKGFSYVLDMAIDCIGKLFVLLGVATVVASLNPLMVWLFMALALVSSYVEMRVQRRQADMQLTLTKIERRTMYYAQVLEDFSYGIESRVNNLGKWLMHRENTHWTYGYRSYAKSNALGMKSGIFGAFTHLVQQVVSYAYFVARMLGGNMSIGDFSMYVGGVAVFSGAVRGVMQSIVEVSEYRKYYDAVEEYLNIPAKMRDNKRLPVPDGRHEIEFRDVCFSYPGQEGYALRNINITIRPGQRLSVVGINGAGKSTFVKLLCRIYDPTKGMILLDGVDIRDIDYDEYVALFSTVFQEYKLYALSIKDNVALSKSDDAGDCEVEAALRKAGFGAKLDGLPNGIHTLVYRNFDGEGFEPSGGEGQKIALARALFKNAPIVVLDEPTAALDPRAEHEIYRDFNGLIENKTAIYISHRLSSSRFCDVVAVFKDGEIIEYGPHDVLMQGAGEYAALYAMQAQYYHAKEKREKV